MRFLPKSDNVLLEIQPLTFHPQPYRKTGGSHFVFLKQSPCSHRLRLHRDAIFPPRCLLTKVTPALRAASGQCFSLSGEDSQQGCRGCKRHFGLWKHRSTGWGWGADSAGTAREGLRVACWSCAETLSRRVRSKRQICFPKNPQDRVIIAPDCSFVSLQLES